MISREWWRLAEVLRLGWFEYRTENPWSVVAKTLVPRVVLQTVFFTLLGEVIAGPGHREYAFVGGLALALTATNIVGISGVLVADKDSATFWRVRTGRLPAALVFFARSAPYPVAGFALLLLNLAVVAPLTGLVAEGVRLLPLLGLYALMSVTVAAAGVATAGLSVGKRADVLATNVLSYLVMLCGGVFLPPGRLWWVDAIGTVLPVRHGLAAVHAALDGRPWAGEALAELAVGAAWAVVAVLVISVQVRRARANGHDDFS